MSNPHMPPRPDSGAEKIRKVKQLCGATIQVGLFDDPQIEETIRAYAITGNHSLYESVFRRCVATGVLRPELKTQAFPKPLIQSEVDGEIDIGWLEETGFTFGYKIDDLTSHVVCSGRSGRGKTTAILNLLSQLIEKGYNVFCIDVKGGEFDGLVAKYKVLKIQYDDLRFNLVKPPKGVTTKHWLRRISIVLSEMLGLLLASQGELYNYIFRAIEKWPDIQPSLKEVIDEFDSDPKFYGKAGSYQDTVRNRINTISNNLSDQFFCRTDFLEDLMHQSWILDLSSSTAVEQDLIIGPLLAYIYEWHRANVPRNRERALVALVVLDEANQNILSIKKTYGAQTFTSSFEQYSNLARSFGIGFVVSFQSPSQVMQGFINNANLKLSFGLGSGRDIEIMADALGLDLHQKLKHHDLQVGECIVRSGSGYTAPMYVKCIKQDLPEPTKEDWQRNEQRVKNLLARVQLCTPQDTNKPEFLHRKIPDNPKRLLLAIGSKPLELAMGFYKLSNLANSSGNKAKEWLVQKGFVAEEEIQKAGSGAKKTFRLTNTGIEIYTSITGKKPKQLFRTRGFGENFASYAHDFIANCLARNARDRGAKFQVGKRVGNQEVDVLIEENSTTSAWEVTLSLSNINKKLALLDSIDRLVFVYTNNAQLKEIQKLLDIPEQLKDRVSFEPAKSYLP